MGLDGLCAELDCRREDADAAVQLLRSLDPRPGSRYGELPPGTYVTPDCVIWRQQGMWRVALASNAMPRIAIQRGYEQMIRHARPSDADYLRGRLQEARWLLKGLESRADTLLRVVRCLVREQAAFLEFGAQALHPLTLRRVAEELGMHESTVSRAIARKYVRTPRGTIALRDFFASGIETGDGGSASSTAIQDMIRKLVAAEDPRKPLSDARLADTLKAEGVPVARRTVAKYREALQIPASHERVRIG
jgi:RNA polymerase sigma-54 factor